MIGERFVLRGKGNLFLYISCLDSPKQFTLIVLLGIFMKKDNKIKNTKTLSIINYYYARINKSYSILRDFRSNIAYYWL